MRKKNFIKRLASKIRLRTWIALGLIAIMLPLVILALYRPPEGEAAWFDESWLYRKRILVTNNTTQETNKYIAFDSTDVLDTSPAEFQTDCDDIRFTDGNGKRLPHFINSGCDTSSTDIDVFFETFPAGAQYIYMYYGNASATSGQASAAFASEATNYTLGTPSSAEKGPSPVAYWKFDEGVDNTCSGGTNDVCNSMPQSLDGPNNGAEWKSEEFCPNGKCLYFDGGTDDVTATAAPITAYPFTMSAWVRTTDSTGVIFELGDADSNSYQSIQFSVNTVIVNSTSAGAGSNAQATFTINDGKWHHISAVYASSTSRSLYIDGNFLNTNTGSVSFNAGIDTWCIADECNSGAANALSGFIDDVKLYNYARTASQIQSDSVRRSGAAEGSSAVLGATSSQNFLSEGLIGYWPIDDNVTGNAQTITDKSGLASNGTTDDGANNTGINCTYRSSTSFAGKYTGACEFDGTDDFISVGDISTYDFNATTSFTISAWIYHDDTGASAERIVSKRPSGSSPQLGYSLQIDSSDRLQGITDDGTNTTTSTALTTLVTTATWNHVAMVVDRDIQQQTLYINGQQVDQDQIADVGSMASNTQPLRIGLASNDNTGPFDGKIDEARLYNRALSSSEMQQLYAWAPGPNIYYNFDQTNTTTLFDQSGNGNNGTLNSFTSASWVPGKYGGAGDFDGTADYVNIDTPNISNNDFTYMAWVKADTNSGNNYIIGLEQASATDVLRWRLSTDPDLRLLIFANLIIDPTSPFTIQTGTWYHVAITRSGSTVSYYQNGILAATSTDSNSLALTGCDLLIGVEADTGCTAPAGQDAGEYWDGLIDEFKIYNYARTASQILEDMNAGHPIGGSPIASQIAYWKMDEMTGTSMNNSAPTSLTGTTANITWSTGSSCKFNGCMSFNGTTSNVDVPDNTALEFTNGNDFSLSAWVYTTGDSGTLIAKKNATTNTNAGYMLNITSAGVLTFYASDGTDQYQLDTASGAFTNSAWNHIVVVYDDNSTTNTAIYINGKKQATTATGTLANVDDVTGGTAAFNLASESDDQAYFAGFMDEVKVYTSALSQAEILIDYNANSAINVGSGTIESSQLLSGAVSNPVGYWQLDDNTSTSAKDASGNANTGTLTNLTAATAWQPARYGSGVQFTGGSDSYITAGSGTTLDNVFASGGTWSAWIKLSGFGEGNLGRIMDKGGSASGVGPAFFVCNDTTNCTNALSFWHGDAGSGAWWATPSNSLTTGTWYHVAATYNKSSAANDPIIYINGVPQTLTEVRTPTAPLDDDNANTFYIGARDNTGAIDREFNGIIDEVKVWNTTLTASQIAYDYNRGRALFWWKFDECSGATAYDAAGVYSKNGTITPGDTSGDNDTVGTCSSGTSTELWNDGTTGKRNSSLGFDGTNDYVSVTTPSLPTGDFTYTVWVYRTGSTGDDTIFMSHPSSGSSSSEIELRAQDADTLQLIVNGGGSYVTTRTLPLNTWTHLAARRSGSTLQIFWNGIPDPTSDTEGTALVFGCDLYIGVDSSDTTGTCLDAGNIGQYWEGKIDDLRIYNYALSEAQIKKVMNSDAAARFAPNEGQP